MQSELRIAFNYNMFFQDFSERVFLPEAPSSWRKPNGITENSTRRPRIHKTTTFCRETRAPSHTHIRRDGDPEVEAAIGSAGYQGAAYLVAAVGLGLLAGAHGVAARRRAGLPRDLCRGRNGVRCCLLGCGLRLPLLPWF